MAKIRLGFVSNSSSSSFIIGIKNDELTKQKLLDAFKIPLDSPLYKLANNLAVYISNGDSINEEELLSDFGYNDINEAIADRNMQALMLQDGYKIYKVSSSSETDNPIEMFMYFGGLNDFKTDNIIIRREY